MTARLINKKLLIIIVVLLLVGCQSSFYERKGFEDYLFIQLKKNNFFEMKTIYWSMVNRFNGTWEIYNDTLILKPENNKVKYKIREKFREKADSIYFEIELRVSNCDGMWYNLYVNNKFVESFMKTHIYYTIKKEFDIKTFTINFGNTCIGEIFYTIRNPNANYFQIQIFDEDSIKNEDTLFKSIDLKRDYFYRPTKFIKHPLKLIPLTNDTPRKEFALKRKFFIRKR